MSDRDQTRQVGDEATVFVPSSDTTTNLTTRVQDAGAPLSASNLVGPLIDQLELPLEVRLGELEWNLERVLDLRVGDSVPVGPDGDDTVTLFVQGRPYALGDLVVVEGRFAFRVREILALDLGASR